MEIVVSEIKRVRSTYGPAALLPMRSSHHNWGLIHYSRAPWGVFLKHWAVLICLIILIAGRLALGRSA
jgi:hypothetical protein